jgi:hypothetical protein
MTFRPFIVTCFLLCQACPADTVGFAGSVLGFVFDPANGLQPILGITGAATIGAPLNLSTRMSNVVISRQQDYALAVTTPDADLLRVILTDSVSIGPLGVPISAIALMALSPSGSAAAFYDSARNRIRVITGLPASGALARDVDLSAFPGELISLAISDAADAVLAGFSDTVVALASDGTVRLFATPQHVTAATFLSKSRDVVIADTAANAVYLVRDVTGSSEPIHLAADYRFLQPVAMGVSNDNQRAIVAISGGVATISLSDGAVTVTSCPCEPSGLSGLSGNAVFRLTEQSGGPIWLFDGDAPQPRIVFVPPYQNNTEDGPR